MMRLRYLLFIVVLLVAVWLGNELAEVRSWRHFAVPPAKTELGEAENRMTALGAPHNPRTLAALEAAEGASAGVAGLQQATPSIEIEAADSTNPPGISSVGADLAGLPHPGPIAVIHSKKILKFVKGKPAPGELARLRQAMMAVGKRWHHPVVILDADGLDIMNSPIIV